MSWGELRSSLCALSTILHRKLVKINNNTAGHVAAAVDPAKLIGSRHSVGVIVRNLLIRVNGASCPQRNTWILDVGIR